MANNFKIKKKGNLYTLYMETHISKYNPKRFIEVKREKQISMLENVLR